MLLECGITVTNSTSGSPDLIGNPNPDGSFLFCPNTTGLAQISTCDSNVETWLYIRGPGSAVMCFSRWYSEWRELQSLSSFIL
jgi:hypothetical protein